MRILDVGCGAGKNLFLIDSEYDDCELYGVDISDKMIEIAEKKCNGSKNSISFTNVDFLEFNPKIKYDVIMFNYVLHHMEDPQMALDKAYGLLQKSGIIMLIVPGTEYLREIFAYCDNIQNDVIGRFSVNKIEKIFSNLNLIQLLYKRSKFLMYF